MSTATRQGNTTPRQFRLRDDTLDDLDWIADHLSQETGIEVSRADAIRYAARTVRATIEKKSKKKTKSA